MNKHLLFCYFALCSFYSFGQNNLSLFGLNHLIDQQTVKPTYFGDHQFELAIFPLSSSIYSNGPAFQDFIRDNESSNVLVYPENKLAFDQANKFRATSSIETFRFIFTKKNWSFSLNHAAKVNGILDYSGALPAIAIRGNAPYIGESVSLDTDFSIQAYEELAFGAAVKLNKIRIGARFKYLSGQSSAITRKSRMSLLTDADIYQLSLTTDLEIDVAGQNTSPLNEFNFGPIGLNFSDEEKVLVQSPELLINLNDDLFNFSGNHGFAFDIGIDLEINEKLSLSLSVLDIGSINWKNSPRKYTAKEIFEFDGLSLGQLTFDGDAVFDFDTAQDSLDIIKFNKSTASFSTQLAPQLYVGLGYEFNDKWRFNATGFYTNIHDNSFSALSVGANYQLSKNLNIGTSYGMMNKEPFLLGLNATLQLGPLQLYALTDNILGAFQIDKSKTLSARVGLGFSFGDKNVEKPLNNGLNNFNR